MIKTKGIIINRFSFKESSLIVKIFTESLGLKSYIINGVRKKKPKYSLTIFEPLNIIFLDAYDKKNKSLNYIADIKYDYIDSNSIFNPTKSITLIFLSDVLNKTLNEGETNKNMFKFLELNIKYIDKLSDKLIIVYVLKFLLYFCNYLGFGITKAKEISTQLYQNNHKNTLSHTDELFIDYLFTNTLSDFMKKNTYKVNTNNILCIIEKIISFYQIHIPAIKNLKSLYIFKSYITASIN